MVNYSANDLRSATQSTNGYLRDISNTECKPIGPLDRQTDVPEQEHHIGSAGSKSTPSGNQQRTRQKDPGHPSLHVASEQLDTSLLDGADKLAQSKGGCAEHLKSSKDPDTLDAIVGPLTEQALRQLNKADCTSSVEGPPSMAWGVAQRLLEPLFLDNPKARSALTMPTIPML